MTSSNHRFNEIDLLRGLACAGVVFFHYCSRAPRAGWISQAFYPSVDAVARYGYLGVHLFFVISGFVILMSAKEVTPRQFLASRAARLLPALWVAATITAGTAWLLAEERFSISLPNFLLNLTMVPHWFRVPYVDGAYWSLAVELHFYIYVWIVLQLRQMHRLEWLLAAWLCVSAINAIRPAWPVEFWLNAKWAPLFVAGGVFFIVRTQGVTILRGGLLLASWLLAVLYAMRESASNTITNPWVCATVVTVFFFVFIVVAAGYWQMRPSRMTQIAGVLTYPIYLVHQIFGCMLYEVLLAEIGNALLTLGITTATVVLVSWATHRYVEVSAGPLLRNWIGGSALLERR